MTDGAQPGPTFRELADALSLHALCRGELAAVQAYDVAIRTTAEPRLSVALPELKREHEARARVLSRMVRCRGVVPPSDGGLWGSLVATVQRAAGWIGPDATTRVLEAGERHGVRAYERRLRSLMRPSVNVIQGSMLPAQEHTRESLAALRERLP